MEPRSLQELAAACGGELRGGKASVMVRRVTTDSRDARPGDLFVALAGPRFNGHDFLRAVAAAGVSAAVVARRRAVEPPPGLPLVVVDDPRRAFGEMAAAYRREFDIPLVCVAGSNGKTTTKELVAAVLGAALPTLKSAASFNNDVGVPATLLRLEARHRAAVLEAGTNHPGELAPLIRMIAPRVGVLTSIGREHLEHFGTLEGVAREEGWLAELLPAAEDGGVLVLAGSIAQAGTLARRSRARVIRAGLGEGADWQAAIRAMDWSGTTFSVRGPDPAWNGEYSTVLPGRHLVVNALLALVVARELGLDAWVAREGLAAFQPAPHRLSPLAAAGVQVLDDTYNANTDSVLAALQTLADLPCTGRRIAVLGAMAEQGAHAEAAHVEVGAEAARLDIDMVVAVGPHATLTAEAAGSGRGQAYDEVGHAAACVVRELQTGDAVLVKASRSGGFERVVEAIMRQLELREAARMPGAI